MRAIKYGVSKLLILVLFCTTLSAKKLNNDNPVDCYYSGIQKVFLHLNKDVYITGEDVLFKAYIVNATNIPDTLCKVIYVELQNPFNQKILGFSVNLFKGSCNSYFALPDTLTTGYYYIKAFTNQMRNFDHDYYFSAKIIVANQADDRLEKLITDNDHNLDSAKVLFYTQNGKLITGIDNKISFKIKNFSEDWDNQPVEIINDSGKVVISVIPDNKGIGDFSLVPEKNKNYFARWNKKKFYLPTQVAEGFIIQAQQSEENKINITILSSTHELSDILNFKVYNNGKSIFEKEFTLSNGIATFTIPTEKNKNGFKILALFNSSHGIIM